jgi:hypothetical protein
MKYLSSCVSILLSLLLTVAVVPAAMAVAPVLNETRSPDGTYQVIPVSATASSSYSPASTGPTNVYAYDDDTLIWNSGVFASPANPAWIQIDLGAEYSVSELQLDPLGPTGRATHQIWTASNSMVFDRWEFTYDSYPVQGTSIRVTFESPTRLIRYIRVVTTLVHQHAS